MIGRERSGFVFVLLLSACVGGEAPEQPVRVGYLPIASDLSFFVALEKRFFEEAGVVVEPIRFESSNQALEALLAGRIEATAIVALEAVLTVELAAPNEFIVSEMTTADSATRVHRLIVMPGSPISSIGDLKGHRVGTFPGSQMALFLRLIVDEFFSPDSMEIVQLRPPLQPQALAAGQVEALFCLEPTCSLVEREFGARVLADNPLVAFVQKPFPTAVGLMATSFVNARPDAARRLREALARAHEYIRQEPELARLTVLPYASVDSVTAAAMGVYDYELADSSRLASVQTLSNLYFREGILTDSIDALRLLDVVR